MKRLKSVNDTPASVYVLSAKQISLSGVSTLLQAVSLIPGLNARQGSNNINIGVRQIPGSLISNLLVMVDGRYYYNPAYPGVPWDFVDIPLSDIDRIELIRGSAGSLWSSRAANGTVNIITKHSIDTQGTELTVSGGNTIKYDGNLRYGDSFGTGGSYRINMSKHQISRSGDYIVPAHDGAVRQNFSGRIDYTFSDDLSLMFTAGLGAADIERTGSQALAPLYTAQPLEEEIKVDKQDLMLRIDHRLSADLAHLLQMSYFHGDLETDSLSDGQHEIFNINYALNYHFDDHQVGAGLEYQSNRTEFEGNTQISLRSGDEMTLNVYSMFLQDEYTISPDKTSLLATVRVDKDPLSGWEYQPSVRLLHTLTEQTQVWGGISRAVNTPTLFASDIQYFVPTTVPGVPTIIQGSSEFDTEKYDNIELGYRQQFERAELDLSLYYSKSENALAFDVVPGVPTTLSPVNEAETVNKGGELLLNLQPSSLWHLQLGATYLDQRQSVNKPNLQTALSTWVQKQLSIRSDYQHNGNVSSFVKVTYQSDYPAGDGSLSDYTTVDAGLTWALNQNVELGIFGQNLFNATHVELPTTLLGGVYTTEIERSWLARARISF